MPKTNSNTPVEKLREIAKKDIERISKTVQHDPSGKEFFWNETHKQFLSKPDDKGKIWVLGIDSSVKGYWFYCPKGTGTNSKGYEIVCNTPHFVFIYQDGEKLTCRECKTESTIKLVLPKE